MSNYPAGSMRGSGIFSGSDNIDVECGAILDQVDLVVASSDGTCEFTGAVDVYIADNGLGYWTCPVCTTEHEIEFDRGPDPDEAYDRMREERDGIFD